MLKLLEKYAGWKIITAFLKQPSTSYYVRELAKKLEMSTFTVSRMLQDMAREDFVVREEKAKAVFYSLKNTSSVSALKRFYVVAKLQELKITDKFLSVDNSLTSLALYGSYASGEYDEKSDLDLICLTEKEDVIFNKVVMEIEKKLAVETTLKAITPVKWRKLAEEKSNFYLTVTRNYILLQGTPLVIV
jgi:predicted nucleotidyltransferase